MSSEGIPERFDVAVIGGGPAGATAAHGLAAAGHQVLLLERGGRIKPCGGAVPPQLIRDFDIPDELLVARVRAARIVSPTDWHVDMPIGDGYVGMVDREVFDEWLRERASRAGAERRTGTFRRLVEHADGGVSIEYDTGAGASGARQRLHARARLVIGADGASSAVARQAFPNAGRMPCVAAYHEIIESPTEIGEHFDGERCDVIYRGAISPDFYGWVFPHGDTTSVGVGSAVRGFSLRGAVDDLRASTRLAGCRTIRREGAPIPLRPMRRWDNGRNVLLAGDACGVVAPASGEGIFYAMTGGRLAAESVAACLDTGDPRQLRAARRRFLRQHGQVFRMLGMMQRYWYATDNRRERFARICGDPDVQYLTWDAYMNKRLSRARPLAHARIFFKNIAHLTGIASVRA